MKIVFTLIADRDANFFLEIAKQLTPYGYESLFISFYEPSCRAIKKLGYEVLNVHDNNRALKNNDLIQAEDYEVLNGVRMSEIILHEKLTYKINKDNSLFNKVLKYDSIISTWLDKKSPDIVIQELGGFIAPLTLYLSCRRKKIKHIFIEPMPYKGTLGFLEDSLNYRIDLNVDNSQYIKNIENYIENYNINRTMVMPKKDRHHFTYGKLWGLFNLDNFRKLIKKIYCKYIMQMGQEYDKIFLYSINKIKSVINFWSIRYYYSLPNFDIGTQYYYYPFHVPLDIQLTVRSPKWIDQITLLCEISKKLPLGVELWIKEHPACVGSYSLITLMPLLNLKNIRFIRPEVNSFDLIKHSRAVITINSKVGIEAIMQDKPVFALGDTCYKLDDVSIKVDSVDEIVAHIISNVDLQKYTDLNSRKLFLSSLYVHSYNGELYDNSAENISNFVKGLMSAINSKNKLNYGDVN